MTSALTACSAAGSRAGSSTEASEEAVSGTEAPAGCLTGVDSNLLPDGQYRPAVFTVRGGSGKVSITCPEVAVRDGKAHACIEFSSPYYEWVKADGVQYEPENAGEEARKTSVFRIPVRLDEEMTISGLTTAMSEPHEIEYEIFLSLTKDGEVDGSLEGSAEEAAGLSAPDGEKKPAEEEPAEAAGSGPAPETTDPASETADPSLEPADPASKAPVLQGLTFVSSMEPEFAETFDIYTYRPSGEGEKQAAADGENESFNENYYLIDVHRGGRYLLVPEAEKETGTEAGDGRQSDAGGESKTGAGNGRLSDAGGVKKTEAGNSRQSDAEGGGRAAAREEILRDLPAGVTVLQAPLDRIYVAATSSMALFDAADAIGKVRFTGTKADGWYIDAPKKALADGSMVYAGKYSAPDYELLSSSGCSLAVESMMILHAPEVKEKLEELGIPVFIDTSSAESHPLGRTEWVRLYGVLTGQEAAAEAFFEKQKKQAAATDSYTDTGLTVAYFSISTTGNVIVRAADDYIPHMIGLAGGRYVFSDLLRENGQSASVRLSMEDFYNTARDADYLIYNATIESPVGSIGELCAKSPLLADFRAVREKNVWQAERSFYQSPDLAAQMILDLHRMLTGAGETDMMFLKKIPDE